MADEHEQIEAAAPEEGQDRPEWLNPRYASVEEQAKAYSEAERAMTAANQRAADREHSYADLVQRFDALEQQVRAQPPSQAYDPAQDPWLLAAAAAQEEGDYIRAEQIRDARVFQIVTAAQQMNQQQQTDPAQDRALGQLFANQTEGLLAQRYGAEWANLKNEVADALQQLPGIVPNTYDPNEAANAIAFVADKIRAEKLAGQAEHARTQQAEADRQKRLAQTTWGGNGPVAPSREAGDQLIEAMKRLKAGTL